ncbi:MAG: glycosyltransferase [Chloroflexi bacterium]|nr:glycosyltransferase [Chloroflexota bacterium]MCI0645207.1 glycosyltransferase [Chloroflexota bacterium]MCI0725279.1 glycosyltransferase [Chloroflexota bacterium]
MDDQPRSYRQRLRHLLVNSRLRHVAGPLYNLVIAQELALQRRLDEAARRNRPAPSPHLADLTAVVKTFERPRILQRLLVSIRQLYPQLRVIVVDDSQQPLPQEGVETIILPFNSGLSAGRRAGLEQVTTPYVLFLDDDFIFYRHTNLEAALDVMKRQPKIDIMGGDVIYLPFFNRVDYSKAALFPTAATPTLPPGTRINGLPAYDKVANFFIGRAERVRLVNWDPALKRLEHADFFTRARGVLTTVFNQRLKCLHAQTPFDQGYMQHRHDKLMELAILQSRYHRR